MHGYGLVSCRRQKMNSQIDSLEPNSFDWPLAYEAEGLLHELDDFPSSGFRRPEERRCERAADRCGELRVIGLHDGDGRRGDASQRIDLKLYNDPSLYSCTAEHVRVPRGCRQDRCGHAIDFERGVGTGVFARSSWLRRSNA